MEKDTFIKRLVQERKNRGYTQKQLAEVLGVSNRTCSKWETGENEPDISTICRLAALYGIPPAAFFTDSCDQLPLRQELASRPFPEAAQCCHAWMGEMYEGLFESFRSRLAAREPIEPVEPPPEAERKGTARAEYPGGALFLRHEGRDANLHLLLMPSEEGYTWLREETEELAACFSLLRDPRLLEPLLAAETDGRQDYFTPEHLAEKAGLSPREAEETLEALARWGICRRVEAKTAAGPRQLYAGGETRLLRAILTLAHLALHPGFPEGGAGK